MQQTVIEWESKIANARYTLNEDVILHWYYTLVQHDFGKMEIKEQ